MNKKVIIFNEEDYPVAEYLIKDKDTVLEKGHFIFDLSTRWTDSEGRILTSKGAYRWSLLNVACFAGLDGRTPSFIPNDKNLLGKSWKNLANEISQENPYGFLKEPRSETDLEIANREKLALEEAEAKVIEEKNAATILPEQLQTVVVLRQVKTEITNALIAKKSTDVQIESFMVMIDYRTQPIRYDDAKLASIKTLLKWDQKQFDSFWSECLAVKI